MSVYFQLKRPADVLHGTKAWFILPFLLVARPDLVLPRTVHRLWDALVPAVQALLRPQTHVAHHEHAFGGKVHAAGLLSFVAVDSGHLGNIGKRLAVFARQMRA